MLSRVKQARDGIQALRQALLGFSPEEIKAAVSGLEEAVRSLQIMEQEVRAGAGTPDDIGRELSLLRKDLRNSTQLIEQGAEFCRVWAQVAGTGPDYTQMGKAVPLSSQGNTSWDF